MVIRFFRLIFWGLYLLAAVVVSFVYVTSCGSCVWLLVCDVVVVVYCGAVGV